VLGIGEEQKERVESGEKENVLGVGQEQKERVESGEKENVLGVGEEPSPTPSKFSFSPLSTLSF
jgi:hypothetical protein